MPDGASAGVDHRGSQLSAMMSITAIMTDDAVNDNY